MKRQILFFLYGFASCFITLVLLAGFHVLPPSKSKLLVSRWHVSEPNQKMLFANLTDDQNEPLQIGVEKLDGPNEYRVGIVTNKQKRHSISFTYMTKSKYGKPTALYGESNHKGLVWRDWNLDGIFDERIDWNRGVREINIEDKWVEGKETDDGHVRTNAGVYVFDANVGAWQIIEPNRSRIN